MVGQGTAASITVTGSNVAGGLIRGCTVRSAGGASPAIRLVTGALGWRVLGNAVDTTLHNQGGSSTNVFQDNYLPTGSLATVTT